MPSRPNPQPVYAETGSTVTLSKKHWGALVTNRGGGALTVTIPAASSANAGAFVDLFQVVDGAFVLSTTTGLVLLNNAAASTLTSSEASEMIGNGYTIVSDGTKWLVYRHPAAEAVTDVVA
jgi:hypothetical protein